MRGPPSGAQPLPWREMPWGTLPWRALAWTALAALLVRLGYLGVVLALGGSLQQVDSASYIAQAELISRHGTLEFWLLRSDAAMNLDRLPLFPLMLASLRELGGGGAHWLVPATIWQAVMSAASALLIGVAAGAMDRRLALPAALIAAGTLNLVLYATLILTDTLFVLFFCAALCALLWALRGASVRLLLLAGLCLGLAALTRPVLQFWPLLAVPVLAFCLHGARRMGWPRAIALACLPGAVMLAVVTPRIIAIHAHTGTPAYVTQTGEHALEWLYPCLKLGGACAGRDAVSAALRPQLEQRLARLPADLRADPLQVDRVQRALAIELIRELPLTTVLRSMLSGALRNLLQTSFYQVIQQFEQPATFFSSASGNSLGERARNWLAANAANPWMQLWVLSQGLLLLARLAQLHGLARGLREPALCPGTVLLLFTLAYFLLVNGPIGYSKYRLPMEPALAILLAIAWVDVWGRVRHRPAAWR